MDARRELVAAITRLTGTKQRDWNDPIAQYAAAAEAKHLWALERFAEAVDSLERWPSASLVERVRRWQQWADWSARQLGQEHPVTHRITRKLTQLRDRDGKRLDSLRESEKALTDTLRRYGPNHEKTRRMGSERSGSGGGNWRGSPRPGNLRTVLSGARFPSTDDLGK